ncbi:MAG TPA: hypothetical protein VJ748_08390 [Vitreimonas sp.]|jgi:hypothetical protein|nr:hypothetical protein [Vitreimonas sp.]
MNERQRDLFLWLWSQRRKPGQQAIALRGAAIGALGGLVFALILGGESDLSRGTTYTGLSVIIPIIERGGMLLLLSVGAFGLLGFILANRVFAAQEAMYQSMLASGARVPEQKPQMQPGDRGPAVAVAIAAAIIAAFIVILFVNYW